MSEAAGPWAGRPAGAAAHAGSADMVGPRQRTPQPAASRTAPKASATTLLRSPHQAQARTGPQCVPGVRMGPWSEDAAERLVPVLHAPAPGPLLEAPPQPAPPTGTRGSCNSALTELLQAPDELYPLLNHKPFPCACAPRQPWGAGGQALPAPSCPREPSAPAAHSPDPGG